MGRTDEWQAEGPEAGRTRGDRCELACGVSSDERAWDSRRRGRTVADDLT